MTMPHLDQEALSAALDGEAPASDSAHLAGCLHCRAELQSLARVAQAVGVPVARPPAGTVEAAIAAALEAVAPEAVAPAEAPAAARLPADPVSISARTSPRPLRPRRSPAWLPAVAGIAAAVVVVGGFVALLGRAGHQTSSTTASLASPSTRAAAGAANPVPALPPRPAPTSGAASGDLGDQADPVAVAQLVTLALQPETGTTAVASRAQALVPSARPPCVAQALATLGSARAARADLRYTARLRWRGQPAVVIVLSDPDGLTGLIMKTSDCAVLSAIPL